MKKISIHKQRILKYIEYKGISKNKFYIETGVSNGVLDKESGISMETVEKIISTYPDINLEWLVTGKTEMLRSANTSDSSSITKDREDLYKELISQKDEKIDLLNQQIGELQLQLKIERSK